MRKSDFREDYEWAFDCPDDDATMHEKIQYQRRLRAAWDAAANNFTAVLDIPLPREGQWWTNPEGIPPHVQAERIKRQLRRYER
jgi:hypothetical protein